MKDASIAMLPKDSCPQGGNRDTLYSSFKEDTNIELDFIVILIS
jgi:hypothetical protein